MGDRVSEQTVSDPAAGRLREARLAIEAISGNSDTDDDLRREALGAFDALSALVRRLEREAAEREKALREYAAHKPECGRLRGPFVDVPPCDCGLAAVLSGEETGNA